MVAGATPLPPRFALGNWWSRYWAYSADELLELMARFKGERIPLSVCIVDMDWHITAAGNESSGWTGYTWNRDLFPDPASFLEKLHGLGLKTALNLHPAEGIHPHEAQYAQFARAIGVDPEIQAPIPFDIANPEFVRVYFELLHHPQEAAGVDFWWLDWQQGTQSQMQGLDPLWWLNHLHYYDLGRDGQKRPFIFSRWSGLGNHRYPIGFSGDTVVSWDSLAFQPYFTSTAANVGFGWWSHDIGGHMGGVEDPELYTRWVQFGVFSPILRLHSTNNPYHERRPWAYDAETLRVTRAAMQLRHALVPYLYSMAWRFNQLAQPLVRPMYHSYPDHEEAYLCPAQYTFGSELIAAPYTSPRETSTRLSRQVVWLPPGEWFDFFNGSYFDGDAWHALYGGLDEIPVFSKAGAIVPLAQPTGEFGTPLPEAFEIHLFPGANNTFELYEDDDRRKGCITPMTLAWTDQRMLFELGPVAGEIGHLPPNREFTFHLHNVARGELRIVGNHQQAVPVGRYDDSFHKWVVGPLQITPAEKLRIDLNTRSAPLMLKPDHRVPMAEQLLKYCRLDSYLKVKLQERLESIAEQPGALGDLALLLEKPLLKALLEILGGTGIHTYRHPADNQPRILCWNNRGHPSATFLLAGLTRWGEDLVSKSGVVPRFAAVVPVEKGVKFIQSSLEDSQKYEVAHLPVEAWRMAVDYYSMLRLNYNSETQ